MPRGRTARSRGVAALLATAVLCLAACSGGDASPRLTTHTVGRGLDGVGDLPAAASAWPEAGYDARFSSATTAIGPQTGHVRWRAHLDGNATPGPVLAADGSVLAATQTGRLYDLDSATGATRWSFDGGGAYGVDLSTSPAVLGNGTILWPGAADTLFALDAGGHLFWKHSFGAQVLSPAIAGHDRVYVADLSGRVVALDVSGPAPRIAWQLDVGGPDYASPSVGQNGTVYTAADHDLVAVRDLGSRGAVLWTLHTRKLVEVSNAVGPNGVVVLGTNNDHEFGVAPSGHVAWSRDINDYTYSSSVATNGGLAYFGDNTGRLRVVDVRSGEVKQVVAPLGKDKEKIWSSAVIDVRGDFYWATTAGHVYGYDRNAKQLFHLDVDGGVNSYPAVGGDGTLYLGTTNGSVCAVGP
ncbi:PQQ-binding-like beta-propeller repeat protein [uncultured Jatrophihabitans sp.]|uniref:outer membrane protein assembly factor BamB family protein n=1 Tax=uncultured Jatrophihabitans sp. TaxID=1610747 RepID=UPI0035CB887A